MKETQREEHATTRARHYHRILERGQYTRNHFRGRRRRGRKDGLWNHRTDDRWRLDHQRQENLRLAVRPCGLLRRHSAPNWRRSNPTHHAQTPCITNQRDAGVSAEGGWDRSAYAEQISRTLVFKDVFIPFKEQLMPRSVYFNAARQWPHMFRTLTPSYMGIAQAAYDFTIRYLRGEKPGTPPVKRRILARPNNSPWHR